MLGTTLTTDDLDLLYDIETEDDDTEDNEPLGQVQPAEDIHTVFRNAMILNPVQAMIKLEESTRPFDSVIDYLFYTDPRGFTSVTSIEKFRRRQALCDAVDFMEWLLSPERESSPSTITFIELIEDEGLDADAFREVTMTVLNPVFTPRFRQMLKDYMEFIHE